MSNKCLAMKAPIVIQQPAVVLQAPSAPEATPKVPEPVGEETNSSTQAEASKDQKIELNCREQDRDESQETKPICQQQEPVVLSGKESTLTGPIQVQTCSTTTLSSSPKTVPPAATLLEGENPSQTHQSTVQTLTPGQPSAPCIPGANTSAGATKSDRVQSTTENKPVRNTEERRILVRTVNGPVVNRTEQPVLDRIETGETRPKIKIQANQCLVRDNRPKIRVEVGETQSIVDRNTNNKLYPTVNTVFRLNAGVRSGKKQDANKSMNDIFGRREEARLKRRAERQAKLRAEAEAMSASKSILPILPILPPTPNTQPLMMSSLEVRALVSPDVSLTRVTHDFQRTPVQPSPTGLPQLVAGAQTPTDTARSPISDKSHSGFMSVPSSMTPKPGSFMHYHKDIPNPDSVPITDPIEQELENEHIDLSESDPEPMEDLAQDTPEESDKMEAEKSSCRDTSPSLSSRTATATASPSRSSSYSASRGSRSGSWTKSSSQSIQSQRSRSRSRSHNSTTSSTTPTRERKSRRRRPRPTPSSPSMQSQSVSRSPTPTQSPRHSSKRKKGKIASDSPVPRKYKNSSTDEFDPDYAPFTEVPPEVRNTEAFCYFGNPVVKERERTPQAYSSRSHSDRYMHSRPSSSRYSRSSYSQHSHTTHGPNVLSYEHTSQRASSSYRGSSYAQGGRSRYNHSGSYNTSPHKNYNSYPQHKSHYNYNNYSQSRGNYNNYSHPRGSYSSQQRGSYNPSRGGGAAGAAGGGGGYPNHYHQKDSYPQKRPSKYESDSGKPQKTDNSGFGAFYRKDDDQWAEEDHDRTVPARLAGRLGPLPPMHHQKSESSYWKGDRGHTSQDRNVFKRWHTSSHSNSDEEYKLNLKIKDIIAKNEQILRRKIELEEDKMIHGIS